MRNILLSVFIVLLVSQPHEASAGRLTIAGNPTHGIVAEGTDDQSSLVDTTRVEPVSEVAYTGRFALGVQGGVNMFDWFGRDFHQDTDFNVRYHGGIYLDIPFGGGLGFQLGLIYSEKGYRETENFEAGEIIVEWINTSQYIDIPFMARITTNSPFSFNFGPQFSYLINNTRTIRVQGEELTESNKSDLRDWDVSAVLGARYTHHSGVFIGASYERSFASVEADGLFEIYNQGFKFTLGYRLPLSL